MDTISVNQFRENLKHCVEKVIEQHQPLKVSRRGGEDFIVISAEDWEREKETLYVLQNNELMQQIGESLSTHRQADGYRPTAEELNNILQ